MMIAIIVNIPQSVKHVERPGGQTGTLVLQVYPRPFSTIGIDSFFYPHYLVMRPKSRSHTKSPSRSCNRPPAPSRRACSAAKALPAGGGECPKTWTQDIPSQPVKGACLNVSFERLSKRRRSRSESLGITLRCPKRTQPTERPMNEKSKKCQTASACLRDLSRTVSVLRRCISCRCARGGCVFSTKTSLKWPNQLGDVMSRFASGPVVGSLCWFRSSFLVRSL